MKHIGYSPFFVCLSVLDIIGAIVLWTLVREPRVEQTGGLPVVTPGPGAVGS